jgi:hypothetical protein
MLHRIDRGIRLPFPRDLNNITDGLQSIAVATLVKTIGARTRVRVTHAVHGVAAVVLSGHDLPIAERLDLLTNGADHRAEVADTELALRLSGGDRATCGEVVDDLTGLAEVLGSGSHCTISPIDCFTLFKRQTHRSPVRSSTVVLQVYSRIGCRQDALKSFLKETLDR